MDDEIEILLPTFYELSDMIIAQCRPTLEDWTAGGNQGTCYVYVAIPLNCTVKPNRLN